MRKLQIASIFIMIAIVLGACGGAATEAPASDLGTVVIGTNA